MRFPIGLSTSMATYLVKKRLKHEQFIPLVLMLEPLFACNLKCSTCGRIREYKDHVSEMMSLEDCFQACRECGSPIVSICGGEPLVYPHIGELINGLIAMRKYVYLCTNGVLLADSLHKLRPSRRLLLNVHIDGPEEVHDKVVEHKGAYAAAVKGIALASQKKFQVTVNTTVCKQSDMNQIDTLMGELSKLGVKSFMLSPAYSYDSVQDKDCFMSRRDIHKKFENIDRIARRHKLSDTPIYLDYLKGKRYLQCTAWGSPTRNAVGWRSPCYLVADKHFATYRELIEKTDWKSYGIGKDARCKDCMMHSGFEPTVALMTGRRLSDIWEMVRWQFS